MNIISDNKTPKNACIFTCIICDFYCSKKSEWDRHISRPKHKNLTSYDNLDNKNIYICKLCNKEYNSRNGLWYHKKKCKNIYESDKDENIEIDNKDLILMLINDNKELRNLLIEQCKEKDELKIMMLKVLENGTNNTSNSHNHTNSHNKSFNLQFFLNETCKDAMNIMDFVDSIKLQLSDLEKVGEFGYVEGISNIITKNLKALDISKRPIHCADKKREVLYVKDENKWEKEDEEKKKLRRAIKKVATKNQRLITEFRTKHPDCNKAASQFSDQYNKIIVESMGGSGDNDLEKEDKIIKNITKVTTIDKNENI